MFRKFDETACGGVAVQDATIRMTRKMPAAQRSRHRFRAQDASSITLRGAVNASDVFSHRLESGLFKAGYLRLRNAYFLGDFRLSFAVKKA